MANMVRILRDIAADEEDGLAQRRILLANAVCADDRENYTFPDSDVEAVRPSATFASGDLSLTCNFIFHKEMYRYKIRPTTTVGRLRHVVRHSTGVPENRQIILGWPGAVGPMPHDDKLLVALGVGATNFLHVIDAGAGCESGFEHAYKHQYNLNCIGGDYRLIIKQRPSDREIIMHVPGYMSRDALMNDVAVIAGIPAVAQVWFGWPSFGREWQFLYQSGISRVQYFLMSRKSQPKPISLTTTAAAPTSHIVQTRPPTGPSSSSAKETAMATMARQRDAMLSFQQTLSNIVNSTRSMHEQSIGRCSGLEARYRQTQRQLKRRFNSGLPMEPPSDATIDVVKIRLRTPGGTFISRSFYMHDNIRDLAEFAESEGYERSQYKLIATWPRRNLSLCEPLHSFGKLLFKSQETIVLERIDGPSPFKE